ETGTLDLTDQLSWCDGVFAVGDPHERLSSNDSSRLDLRDGLKLDSQCLVLQNSRHFHAAGLLRDRRTIGIRLARGEPIAAGLLGGVKQVVRQNVWVSVLVMGLREHRGTDAGGESAERTPASAEAVTNLLNDALPDRLGCRPVGI